jgi:hypothetical protein
MVETTYSEDIFLTINGKGLKPLVAVSGELEARKARG